MSADRGTRARAARPRARVSRRVGGTRPIAVRLVAEAERARKQAYAPYSRFRVGAALLARDGRIFTGCNVENASFGLSICAERNAVWKAVSEGVRDFVAVAVTAGAGNGAPPCGSCRQVLHEFAPDLVVYWRQRNGRITRHRLEELLHRPFSLIRERSRGR